MPFRFYPDNSLQKLELHKLFELVNSLCVSDMGQIHANKVEISNDFSLVNQRLSQVSEFKALLQSGLSFPVENLINLEEEFAYLEIVNSVLNEEQFQQVMLFLETVHRMYHFFQKNGEEYPALNAMKVGEYFERQYLDKIKAVLSNDGVIKPGVSPELDRLRKDIKRGESDLDRKFDQLLRYALKQGWLEQGEQSLRNGRRVLALHSEHRRKLKGIIHDESHTGKTVFVEPEETVEINNELVAIRHEEARERHRILKKLSDDVRPATPIWRDYQRMAGLFDFTRAKASLAIKLNAYQPQLKHRPTLKLIGARHPLLVMQGLKDNRAVVPLNLSLDEKEHVLVISGPNAGGKSVALKTVGLLVLMVQAGLLIPAQPDSEIGLFANLFVELGDAQSIENDLSTYSSHLKHLKFFTEKANKHSLFLIDEFGTGTDPKFGGAIAEAVLQHLVEKGAFGVITTHFSNLKVFAGHTPGVINGSMLFDKEHLKPLFVLKTGQPGSSFSFEIAKKIGLSGELIEDAQKRADHSYQSFDELLATLETEKHWISIQQKKLKEDQEVLDGLISSYTDLKQDIEQKKKTILLESKQKALAAIESQNKRMEKLLSDIAAERKEKDQAEKSAAVRAEVKDTREKLKKEVSGLKSAKPAAEPEEIRVGDHVRLQGGTEVGIVAEMRQNRALVVFQSMRSSVSTNELTVVKRKEELPAQRVSGVNYRQTMKDFSPNIDVRGMRADEAVAEVEKQLDKAVLMNYHSLSILHGTGTGSLRKAIRAILSKYDFVQNVRSEHPDAGGDGITVVDLA
jgi:DNA mismatch repair protein MutS2